MLRRVVGGLGGGGPGVKPDLLEEHLRRLALQARDMQPRSRSAGASESLAALDARALHECALGYMAGFTAPAPGMPTVDWIAAQPAVASLSHAGL